MAVPSAPAMNEGEVEMQALLSIQNTRCFTIVNGHRHSLGRGELNVCRLDDRTLFLYIPEVFQYAVNKQFPSLRASKNSFVFPGHNGTCFGVVFGVETSTEDLDMFEALLVEFSQYAIDEMMSARVNASTTTATEEKQANAGAVDQDSNAKYEQTGKKVASCIKKGTVLAQKGIRKGASVTGAGIRKSNEFLKKRIKSRKQLQVSEKTKARIEKAKQVTAVSMKVSAALVVGAKVLCSELASAAATAVSQTEFGQKLTQSQDGKVKAAKEVTKATISGAVVILGELHDAAVVLVSQVADSSADLARYKYGDEAGDAADNVAEVTKAGVQTGLNVLTLGVKPLVATVAAHGTVDVVSTKEEQIENRKARRLEGLQGADSNVQLATTMAINNVQQTYNV